MYYFWFFIGLIVGLGIYWIMDWKKKFPDGD